MEANIIFNNILYTIEKSSLNYWISKTPFSATISLKSSIATPRYKNAPAAVPETDYVKLPDESKELKAQISSLEKAALKIEKSLKKEIQALVKENEKFQKLYEGGKDMLKNCEKNISELRDELLQAKKEKRKTSDAFKVIEKDLDNAQTDIMNLKTENTKSSKVIKIKTAEAKKLTDEKELLEKKIVCLEANLVNEIKENSNSSLCTFCALTFKKESDLQNHVKVNHHHEKCAQCSESDFSYKKMIEIGVQVQNEEVEEFREYLCFYCEIKIESSQKLELHRRKCHETKRVLSDYPCDQCGAQCKNVDDLGRHRTTYHGLGTFSDDHGQERFWCDTCNVNFETDNQLRTHVGELHLKQM